MSNAHSVYQDLKKAELHLHLDIDLKSQKILDFTTKGSLVAFYQAELDELKDLVLNQTLQFALSLKRSALHHEVKNKSGNLGLSSLSLWLLHKAIEEYTGAASTISDQTDLLCLCYGVTKKDLKKQILARSDYDLAHLAFETMATTACGSCRSLITQAIMTIREEHGLIIGLDHSQSRLDKNGHWVKIKGLYPCEIIIRLDELKTNWMKREEITEQFEIEIVTIEGHHLWLSVHSAETFGEDQDRFQKVLAALRDYWRSEFGVLFFLHLQV